MISHIHIVAALVGLLCGVVPFSGYAEQPESALSEMSQADLFTGKKVFSVHCARCHGMAGEGGEGPSLKRPTLKHAADDVSLVEVITDGLRGTGMPSTFGPSDADMRRVAGYVRSLGRLPVEQLPGDPATGEQLFNNQGACATCHITNGVGRGVGPELTDVGLRRNAQYLRRSLTNPDADQPLKYDVIRGNLNAFLTVRVVSQEGEFEGVRVNEDEFSVQVRDLSGKVQSFNKQNLLNYRRAFGHSLMPEYERVFSVVEVDDLVSYLMELKGVTR
jgi:putative heme-binding domain-containing protein